MMSHANGAAQESRRTTPRDDRRVKQIADAAANTDVSDGKLRLLMQFEEQAAASAARAQFDAAFSIMQSELPPILKRRSGTGVQEGPSYAHWEDINEAIKPILKVHGFALRFRTAQDDSSVIVTCLLGHVAGHVEETALRLPLDMTGGKNQVQAIGSTTSYGKRYTASALLNLTAIGEDDDGSGGPAPSVSAEQASRLRQLLEIAEAAEGRLLAYFKIAVLESLPAKQFSRAVALLRAKAAKK